LFLSLAVPSLAGAQSRVSTRSAVLASPKGQTVGSVHPGVEVRVLETRGAYARVSLEGFVERARLVAPRGKATTDVGKRSAILRARGSTAGRSVASLDAGTTVRLRSEAAPKGWVRVSRTAWVLRSALEQPAASAPRVASSARAKPEAKPPAKAVTKAVTKAPSDAPRVAPKASGGEVEAASTRAPAAIVSGSSSTAAKPSVAAAPAGAMAEPAPRPLEPTASGPMSAAPLSDSALVPTSNVALRAAPDARALATIAQGTSMIPLARERGWVRVRVEGWVPERDLAPADTTVRTGISAADLRADPEGSRGKVVRWGVQVLARQTADPLRKDLAADETYLLARGPSEENALLYLVVPPAMLDAVKGIPALSQAMITARVRTGKSQLVGVPILDLITITPGK
jgi:hypothetical protein